MKTAFFGIKLWEKEYLCERVANRKLEIESAFITEILTPDKLPADCTAEIVSVFVDSLIDKTVIDIFPNLKFLALRSTGFDHVDLASARARQVAVSNVPSYGENTVAEQAFALLLSLSRKIFQAYDQIKETGSFKVEDLQGFDLKGKTIGVIGTGRIGRHSIWIAKGFGMSVVAYDPLPNPALASELGFEYSSFDEVLEQSDVITIHVPYLSATHHLFNQESFRKMKKGAYLINTARGAVVDTQALVAALKTGQLGGVGLDVLEEEGVIKDELDFIAHGRVEGHDLKTVIANHALIDMPNVVITPHNAFNTREALQRILDTTLDNIAAFITGQPINIVKQ